MGPERPREIHAIWHGFVAGIYGLRLRPKYSDSEEEPHYFRLGYVLGDITQIIIILGIIYMVLSILTG